MMKTKFGFETCLVAAAMPASNSVNMLLAFIADVAPT